MITSSSNPKLRQIAQLNQKAKTRRESGLFVAEGLRLFREIPPEMRGAVFAAESFASAHEELLAGIRHEVVEDRLFERICDTETPQGILCVTRMPAWTEEDLLGGSGREPLLLILEDVQDPGNVGTMLRTAEAAGATGVVLGGNTADLYQPKVIRATMGSVFRVPHLRVRDLPPFEKRLQARGVRLAAAHLSGSVDHRDADLRGGIAFCIGNEGSGLSGTQVALADLCVRIPMHGRVESLNAAVAAAVLLYEAERQRS